MIAHRFITNIGIHGSLKFSNLPFEVGQKVEVIILPEQSEDGNQPKLPLEDRFSLQGMLKKYIDLFDGALNSSD